MTGSHEPGARVSHDLTPGERAIEVAILSHALACGPDRSISPGDVAMAMGPDWRTKLSAVRRAAIRLALAGRIDILRKGKPVEPHDVRGVIRLRIRAAEGDTDAATAPTSTP